MDEIAEQVAEAAGYVRSKCNVTPHVGVILGSGLGALARNIEGGCSFPYAGIPHFAPPTAVGHRGELVVGKMAGVPVVALQGRIHSYEGHSPARIALGVRVMHGLGARLLVVTNAAGGLNPSFRVGEIVTLTDQINLTFRNPLAGEGANGGRMTPGRDGTPPYDLGLIELAEQAARREDFPCHRGVYVGMLGPMFETRAEYRFLRRIGGDVVGMSTVGEVRVARQLGLQVLGLSVVSNVCSPDRLGTTSGDEVVAVVASAVSRVGVIVRKVLEEVGGTHQGDSNVTAVPGVC